MKLRTTIASTALMAIAATPMALVTAPQAQAAPAPVAPAKKLPAVTAKTYKATGYVNVRSGPGTKFRSLGVLRPGAAVKAAGTAKGRWQPVTFHGRTGWVSNRYLTAGSVAKTSAKVTPKRAKVTPKRAKVTSSAARNVSMPRGVNANGYRVATAVRNNFPQIAVIGGYRPGDGGDHGSGRAVDIMIPNYRYNNALGDQIAAYLRANASRLGISYVIWDQHIWSVQRSGEGWRAMSNRGDDNANHKNHVHVSVR
ncbi:MULTISPECIES: SH3 domain-containing protein [unclassified Luteococcus]|uniref:SH3 domain-containing protein n=1 Tax=unclassified Luteococcus TaxID=2639923 RepID=UPI00313B7BF3